MECFKSHTTSHTWQCCLLSSNSCHHATSYPCTSLRNASACWNTSGQELKQSVLPRRQHSFTFNGTHFYAFFAFIAFIALGAAAAAFFAPFFAMLLIAGGPEKVPWECKCHSRQASLNQTKHNKSHITCDMSMSSMATIRNISKRNTAWMQDGSPPHGLFHPWARWAWGLANFKSCSRIGACTVWWVWHTKSMGKHCFGETEWLNQAPGALKHNSLAPEEARIAGKVL